MSLNYFGFNRIGKRFAEVLLYQSFLMIAVQLVLLHEFLKYRFPISPTPNRRWFWNWYSYKAYLFFLIMLSGLLGLFQFMFYKQTWFVETLGFLVNYSLYVISIKSILDSKFSIYKVTRNRKYCSDAPSLEKF